MTYQRNETPEPLASGGEWQVTYFNEPLGYRCVLIDNIDEATANAVVSRFGDDRRDPYSYLPEVRKEQGKTPGIAN